MKKTMTLPELRVRDDDLKAQVRQSGAEKTIALIMQFITESVESSQSISNIKDRIELSSMLRHWGNEVLKVSGAYPEIELKPPVGDLTLSNLGWKEWQRFCATVSKDFVQLKIEQNTYHAKWSISRPEIEEHFNQFLTSDRVGLALTGRAGMGKTFFVCQLADGKVAPGSLVLPFDAYDLGNMLLASVNEPNGDLSNFIGDLIAKSLGFQGWSTLLEESRNLDEVLSKQQSHLVICIDGVERFKMPVRDSGMRRDPGFIGPKELLISLNYLLTSLGKVNVKRVKFVITCVTSLWLAIGVERVFAWNYFYPGPHGSRSLGVEAFEPEEFREAWRNYVDDYGIQAPADPRSFEEFTEDRPFLLRLAVEIMKERAGKLPTKDDILARYFSERVLRGNDQEQIEKDNYLARFADLADAETKTVSSRDADLSSPAYMDLLVDGIITVERRGPPRPSASLAVDPAALVDYLRALHDSNRTKRPH